MKERAGEEFSVWFGVSMFREKLPSSERETQEGMAGEVGGKVQWKAQMAGSMKRGSHETTVGDSCSFGAWSENGRKEKFAANRNVFMEVGWWSKRGSSHGRLGAKVPVATPHP
jgi:hypothetical protein